MNTADDDRAWIREGARVAIYTYGNPDSVRFGVIERLTATQVVLEDNTARFRRTNLRPVGEDRSGFGWTELKQPDDERVRNTYAVQRLRNLVYQVGQVAKATFEPQAMRGGNQRELAVAALDEIERAVAKARAAIERKPAAAPLAPPALAANPAAREVVENWLADPRRPDGAVYYSAQDLLGRLDAALDGEGR